MKTKLYLLFFFVFPLFMSACRGDDPIPDPPVDGKRTVLVYMAADNSINPLASFTDGDLEELKAGMASIDNTSDMHLLVYIDTGFPRLIEIENKGGTVVGVSEDANSSIGAFSKTLLVLSSIKLSVASIVPPIFSI